MPMPFPASISSAILDTILGHLAPHFLTGTSGDVLSARHAASHMLAAYDVATEEELRLAAEIISFGFHALEALGQAAAPELPLNKTLRLRGSAVSLSREAHKSQRKLDQLQRARRTATTAPEAQATPTTPDKPGTEQAIGLIEFAREALEASTKSGGVTAWTLSRQQRRAAERIAENFKRNKAEQARRAASLIVPAETQIQFGAA